MNGWSRASRRQRRAEPHVADFTPGLHGRLAAALIARDLDEALALLIDDVVPV